MESRLVIIFLFCLCFVACKQKKGFVLRQQVGNYLVIDSYNVFDRKNNMVKLYRSKYYTKNIIANGAEIYYDTNGNILKWLWFDKSERLPLYGIYFKKNGQFDTMRGDPFIGSIVTKEDKVAVEMVNPPNIKYIFGYRDFVGDKLVHQQAYEPAASDSTAWATLDWHKFELGHTYKIYYYILDKNNKIVDSMSRELVPPNTSSASK